MPYVLTVDQIDSRVSADLVEGVLGELNTFPTVLPFTRTVGDELQGLLDQPRSVVGAILALMRKGQWHIGLGIGGVQAPLPPRDPRAARGDAFIAARTAVERAKSEASHVAVASMRELDPETADVETMIRLVGAVRGKRTEQGWEVADLLSQVRTHAAAAARLKVSRQAVGQRAQTAQISLEQAAVPTLVRLLERAERASLVGGSA